MRSHTNKITNLVKKYILLTTLFKILNTFIEMIFFG